MFSRVTKTLRTWIAFGVLFLLFIAGFKFFNEFLTFRKIVQNLKAESRIAEVLVSLGRAELRRLAEEKGGAEVTCEFCRTAYRFGRGELEQSIREIESGRPPEAPAPQK